MTLLLSYTSIEKSYGGEPLFSDLSVSFHVSQRLGLIGDNGCGKSTLLKIVAGIESPEKGEKTIRKHTRLAYVPQEDRFDPEKTVYQVFMETIEGDRLNQPEKEQRVKRIISIGGFPDSTQKTGTLSGGWVKRLAILNGILQDPDLLLLDEPTNHLDIESILWLEELLKKSEFSFVAVTHDRTFLDTVCTEIMELGTCYPEGYLRVTGNYENFRKRKAEILEAQLKQEASLQNKMRRETEWLRQGAKARSTKAKYRINNAQVLEMALGQVKKRNRRTGKVAIEFTSTQRKTKKLIALRSICKSINDRPLFKEVSLDLTPGTCLGLIGGNGSGKTTLMNILEGRDKPDSGEIRYAQDLKIAVFDQQRDRIDPDTTLKQALSPAGDSLIVNNSAIHVVSWAKKFLFSPDQLTLPVRRLSGGEKARIHLASLMAQPADVLLLDEPTNDLDIASLEVLEESLMEFPGAVVIVSHDRSLLENITSALLFLDGQGNTQLVADYNQVLAATSEKPVSKNKEKKTPSPSPKKKLIFSFKHKYELEQIEARILDAEAKVQTLEASTLDPEVTGSPETLTRICTQLKEAQEEVESLYNRWDELETLKALSQNQD